MEFLHGRFNASQGTHLHRVVRVTSSRVYQRLHNDFQQSSASNTFQLSRVGGCFLSASTLRRDSRGICSNFMLRLLCPVNPLDYHHSRIILTLDPASACTMPAAIPAAHLSICPQSPVHWKIHTDALLRVLSAKCSQPPSVHCHKHSSVCPLLSVTAWRRSFFCNASRLSFISLSCVRKTKACLCNPWSSWSFHRSSAETTARECNVLSCVSAASCAHSPLPRSVTSASAVVAKAACQFRLSRFKAAPCLIARAAETHQFRIFQPLEYLDCHCSCAEKSDPQITVQDTVVDLMVSISTHASGSSICSTRISSRLLDRVIGLSALLLSSSDSRPLILQLFVQHKLDEHGALDCSSNWLV